MTPKQVKALSDKELQVKVAELCGWERGPEKDIRINGLGIIAAKGQCWHRKSEEDNWQDNPPDYCFDRNAIEDACIILPKIKQVEIAERLKEMFKPNPQWGAIFATARQRAEAFVLVMEG